MERLKRDWKSSFGQLFGPQASCPHNRVSVVRFIGRSWSSRWHRVLALMGYTLLTLVMTYPLSLRLSSHLAGSGDDMWLFQWNNWWLRKALLEGLDPYFTPFLFHPRGVSLVYHNFSWLNTGIWLVLEPVVGAVAAYNVTFLLTFVISGYGTYVLVFYLTRSRAAAFVAGLVFAFSPYHLSQFNHPNLISVQWLPFCLLFLIRTVRGDAVLQPEGEGRPARGRWRDVLLCIVFLVLTGLSRWQLLVFAAILMALYVGYSLLFERTRWSKWTVLALMAIGLGTAVCISPLTYPLVAGLADEDTASEILTEQQDWAQTDLLAYVVPNRFHPLFGAQVMPIYERFRKNRGHIAFLGYSVLLLAGYGVLRARRSTLYWMLAAVCLVLLALGPVLRFNGRLYPGIPMPYHLLGWLPPIRALRNSDRYNVVLSLPLAVLVGYGVFYLHDSLRRHLPSRWGGRATAASGVILAGLVLFEFLSLPFPTVAPLSYPFYRELAQEEGTFAILEVPMGRQYSKAYMFLQTLHGKRLVEGHVSRTPPQAYRYIESQPLLASLADRGDLDTDRCDLSRQLGALAADDVRYIVIHKVDVPAERLAAWEDYLTVPPIYEDDGLLVYPTRPLWEQPVTPEYVLGGNLGLLRAEVTPGHTTQGGTVSVDLRWTTTYTPTGDYAARLALVSVDKGRPFDGAASPPASTEGSEATLSSGEVVREEIAPLCDGWPTSDWGRHALVIDRRHIQVDPYLPPSTYHVALSVVEPTTGRVLGLTQVIADLEVSALERRFVVPPMQYTVAITFGQVLALPGYDLHQDADALHLTLHWRALRRPQVAYKFFLHLYDVESEELVAQEDVMPRGWTYPTNWWEAGEVVSDEIRLFLSGVPPGRYRLVVGVYDPQTGDRLLVQGAGRVRTRAVEAFPIPQRVVVP
jgi:hypothetical protein